MPSTNAERKKKYLEKLKADGKFEAYQQKKAADEKQRRERVRRGLELLPKAVRERTKRSNNAYMRKKNAEYRRRKKLSVETASLPSTLSNSVPSTLSSSLPSTMSNSVPSTSSSSLPSTSSSSLPSTSSSSLPSTSSSSLPSTSSSSLPSTSSSSLPSTSSSSLPSTLSNSVLSTSANFSSDDGYKTKSALYKAVGKLQRAMPSTARKQKEAVSKFLKTFSESDRKEIITLACTTGKTKSTRAINSTVIESVKKFYERDDVSRISPNMRDCRKFVNPATGVTEVKQIRYLMYRIMDVYHMFLKHVQNGDTTIAAPIKPTKFFELRPKHIKTVNCTPLESCFCLYHSNFIMCCEAIHRSLVDFPKYGADLDRFLLCENPKENCWLRKCPLCSNAKIREKTEDIVKRSRKRLSIRLNWKQWEKNNETNRFQKHVVPGTLKDLLSYFFTILSDFLKHSYVKRCQAETFENDSEEVRKSDGTVATLQLDFAESFTCEAQDEIQSAHWNQANV